MASHTDILKAPTRKRKPENVVNRQPRVVKMSWDINPKVSNVFLDGSGLGLSKTEDGDQNVCQQPTPPVVSTQLVPPGAPKMTLIQATGPFTTYVSELSPSYHIEPQGLTDTICITRKTRVNDGIDHWSSLSDEMVLQVFRWLPKTVMARCLRVCKRWNRLALDETLWRRLDLANKTLKSGVIGRVLDRGTTVLRLTRSDIRTPLYNDNTMLNIHRFSKLAYLDVSMAVVSQDGLEQLLSYCHLLQKLSLENCSLTDKACRYIGQNRDLEVLNLSMCQGITENGLVPICNNLTRLESLNLGWTGMSRGAVVYAVVSLPPNLTKLNLSGCRETLLDEDVEQLCISCKNLKELDLSDATLLTSLSVQHIATSLGGLEYIALSRCYHIIPSSLPLLLNILTLLALDVFGMLKESALYQLREAMPSIEINKFPFSSIARPTTGIRRTSIWGLRVRDSAV